MTKPKLDLFIVDSTMKPGLLSVRLGPTDKSASGLKKALKDAGFKAGDLVTITLTMRGA